MPLFDYLCRKCGEKYEEIVRSSDVSQPVPCPKCRSEETERQIVRFRVGGRGDLRESTEMHGCHPSEEAHSHSDHSHSHDGED